MCGEEFFLSLKANSELFNFIQQATLLLTFASALLSFFAFRNTSTSELGFQQMQKILQAISLGLWTFSGILIFTVLMAYLWESRYQPTKNAWGETIYSQKGASGFRNKATTTTKVATKKLKRQKAFNRNDISLLPLASVSPSFSTYGSSNTPSFRSLDPSPTNMSANDVIVNMNTGTSTRTVEECC